VQYNPLLNWQIVPARRSSSQLNRFFGTMPEPMTSGAAALGIPVSYMHSASTLSEYRSSSRERERVANLLSLTPSAERLALDVGARDGHLCGLLEERFDRVVGLDLERPARIDFAFDWVQGDVTALPFRDDAFYAVLCSEVLEHIPAKLLELAC